MTLTVEAPHNALAPVSPHTPTVWLQLWAIPIGTIERLPRWLVEAGQVGQRQVARLVEHRHQRWVEPAAPALGELDRILQDPVAEPGDQRPRSPVVPTGVVYEGPPETGF